MGKGRACLPAPARSSTERQESKTEKCLKLELPNPSWGSLERSPGPGALGELHKRQWRGREGSSGTAASRARHRGSGEPMAASPSSSHRLLTTSPPRVCIGSDAHPLWGLRGPPVSLRASVWGCSHAGTAGIGIVQSQHCEHPPSDIPACLSVQETHRPHTEA